jgi:hypothetical protein
MPRDPWLQEAYHFPLEDPAFGDDLIFCFRRTVDLTRKPAIEWHSTAWVMALVGRARRVMRHPGLSNGTKE